MPAHGESRFPSPLIVIWVRRDCRGYVVGGDTKSPSVAPGAGRHGGDQFLRAWVGNDWLRVKQFRLHLSRSATGAASSGSCPAITVIAAGGRPHVTIRAKATNTVYEGGSKPSRLVIPVVPR